jgi:hypothetical protein
LRRSLHPLKIGFAQRSRITIRAHRPFLFTLPFPGTACHGFLYDRVEVRLSFNLVYK